MIYGIVGNRTGWSYEEVDNELERLNIKTKCLIVSGGATGVVIDLYDGNPSTNGELIASKLITYVGAGQSEVVSLKMHKPPNFDNIYLIVDRKNIIEESSEINNQLIIHYTDIIKVDAGPDQQVEEEEPVEFLAKLYGGISGDFIFLWDFGDGNIGENIITITIYLKKH